MNAEELTAISNEIIKKATAREQIKALGIFFFLPGTDTSSFYTAGKADWAPGGDWGNAN